MSETKISGDQIQPGVIDASHLAVDLVLPPTTIAVFTNISPGLAPLSGGGTTNFLRADGTWAAPAGGVTSVGLSLPSIFIVTNSPVTSSGVLTGTLATQTAGTFFAGPITGSAATPAFRTLSTTDIPTLNQDTTGKSAKTDALNSATTIVNIAASAAPTTGQFLIAVDATHATWQTIPTLNQSTIGNAGSVTNGIYTTDTGTVTAKMLQQAAADLGAVDININLSNTHAGNVTNLTLDGTVTAGQFTGPVTALKSATTAIDVLAATAPSNGQVLTATDSTHATWQTPSPGASTVTDALKSATTSVDVSAATAPSLNQVLTATDSTHATWQTPSVPSGTLSGLTTGRILKAGSATTAADTDLTYSAGTVATIAGTALSIASTAPSATIGVSQVGKNTTLSASAAVASTDTAGAAKGGNLVLQAGDSARNTSGDADGGDLIVSTGNKIGTGRYGVITDNNSYGAISLGKTANAYVQAGSPTSPILTLGYLTSNAGLMLAPTTIFGWGSAAPVYGTAYTPDTFVGRNGSAGSVVWGSSSATPVAYIHRLAESSRGTTDTNIAGANATIASGLGTGTGTGSSLIFQTPTATTTGTVQQALATRLTLTETASTFTNPVALAAGTTAIAPLVFTSGPLRTTTQAGAMEFLTDSFYLTTSGGGSNVSVYPTAQTATYVIATSTYNTSTYPYYATDPAKSLTGGYLNNSWLSGAGSPTNQRFHIDYGTAVVVTRIYYENYHQSGAFTTAGVKNFTLWGSNNAAAFSAVGTYGTDTNWTQLTTATSLFLQHVSSDTADPKYITVTNSTAYRYYAFKFADNYGDSSNMGYRRVELQVSAAMRQQVALVSGTTPLTATRIPYATTGGRLVDSANITTDGSSISVTANLTAAKFYISALNTAPASATDTGTLGEIRITATYIYVCTATNVWVRAALATWP